MVAALKPTSSSADPTETREALAALVGRKGGAIPTALLVDLAERAAGGGDWPVARAAMEALLRRAAMAKKGELTVARRPARGAFGDYQTKVAGSTARPYATALYSLSPFSGSCACPDYLKSSLGLCKHLAVVVEDAAGRARPGVAADPQPVRPLLGWDPIRPARGPGDWLERVTLRPENPQGRPNAALVRARRWFAAGDGRLRLSDRDLDKTDAGSDARRREVIADLHAFTRAKAALAEPAVRALVQEEARRLEERAAHAVDDKSARRALRGFKTKLYPYQLHGVNQLLTRMRLLLADDMGLGKTAQAIACAHVLWQSERVKRALVVVPASLKSQWQREWQRFTDAPLTMIEGGPDERRRAYRQARGFLLVNYEQVIKDLPELLRLAPDAVFLDEAQRMKNWATKTATFIKALSPRWRLALTGTPMENRLDDLASILDWIDDRALAPVWRLGPWHSSYADGVRGVVGARNLDTLRARIAGTVVRRVRKEVLEQLPPRTDVRVPAAMTEAQRAEHAELDRPIASLVNRAKRRPLSQEEFLQLMTLLAAQRTICNGLALRHFADVFPGVSATTRPSDAQLESLSSPKLIELRAVLRALIVDQRRKVVVFSQWRRMLELCAWATRDILDDAGLRCVFFTGNESQKRRTQNIVDFHDDDTAAVLYCTDAGGVGLNLQRAANACINVELPWNPAVLEQRIGRIYRLGQESPIDVFHLVTDGGIEPRIASLVADKRAVFTGLFDGSSDAVAFDRSGSFMDRIEQLVAPQQAPAVPQAAVDAELDDAEVDAVGAPVEEPVEEPVEQAPFEPAADTAPMPVQAPVPLDLAALFGQVRVSMSHDGSMTLTAPPEAARTLAGVLSGMARLLEAQPAR